MFRNRLLPALTLAACLLGSIAYSGQVTEPTVGDLMTEIARLKSLPVQDSSTAVVALTATGVSLPDLDLDRSLTEGDVAAVLTAVGVPATTSRPDAPVLADRMDVILSALGDAVARGGYQESMYEDGGPYPRPNDQAADPATKGKKKGSTKGKGKKKGHGQFSPSDPI